MTATVMPLAWVRVMILPTSASMAASLGIACARAVTGRQKAGKSMAKNGRTLFLVLMMIVLTEPDHDGLFRQRCTLWGLIGVTQRAPGGSVISGRLVKHWGPDVVFDTGSCHPARHADAAVRANGPRAWWRLQREHKAACGGLGALLVGWGFRNRNRVLPPNRRVEIGRASCRG